MGVQNLSIVSPPDGVSTLSTGRLRPQSLARWENNGAGGTTTYQVLHEWDTDSGFGSPITDLNTGLSSTTFEDVGVPPSDLGPSGTTWYYQFTVTDDDDAGNATSPALYDMTFVDPLDDERRMYSLVNVGADFRERAIVFDDVNNQYISGEDVNVMDSDSAHVHQGIKDWQEDVSVDVTGTPQTPPQALPPFGGITSTFALECVTNTLETFPAVKSGNTASTEGFPLALSTQYSATAVIFTELVSKEFRVTLIDYDGGDVEGDSQVGSWVVVPANVWTEITATGTTAADAVNGLLRVECRELDLTDVEAGSVWYQAAHCVRTGAVADFVPSIRMSNEIQILIDATPGSTDWRAGLTKAFSNFAGHTTTTTSNGWHLELDGTGRVLARRSQAGSWLIVSPAIPIGRRLLEFILTLDRLKLGIDGAATVDSSASATTHVEAVADIIVGHSTGTGLNNSWFGDMSSFTMFDGEDGPVVAHLSGSAFPDGSITDLDTWTNPITGREWTAHGTGLVSRGGLDIPTESKRQMYVPLNLGPGFAIGEPDDAIESERQLYVPLNITTDVPVPYIKKIEPIVVNQLDSLAITGRGFDNAARGWGAVARLYDSPDLSGTFVGLSETGYEDSTVNANGDDVLTVTVPGGAQSGWVVVWNSSH